MKSVLTTKTEHRRQRYEKAEEGMGRNKKAEEESKWREIGRRGKKERKLKKALPRPLTPLMPSSSFLTPLHKNTSDILVIRSSSY